MMSAACINPRVPRLALARRTARALQHKARLAAAVLIGLTTALADAGDIPVTSSNTPIQLRPLELQIDARLIFQAVARKMGIALAPTTPMPAVHLASKTTLQSFQRAVEAQWSPAPQLIGNTYSVAENAIYLDDRAHRPSFDRTLDDALAHEFVHFFQSRYLGAVASTEEDEQQAVSIQLWFRRQSSSLSIGRR